MPTQATGAATAKLSAEQFINKAIVALRKPGYKGIHSVYSGFNQAYREYFGEGADPVAATKLLVAAGKLVTFPTKGGAMVYLPADAPTRDSSAAAKKTLAQILS